MLKLIRLLLGYVIFSINSPFPERFFNLVAKKGIRFWDVEKEDNIIKASIIAGEYKDLRGIAKKTRTRTKILKRVGLVFLIRKYKNRVGIPTGLMLSVFLASFMSMYIWGIDIDGNEKIDKTYINSVLSELGLFPGAYKKNIDPCMVEHAVMIKLSDISWISVNIEGNIAKVSLKERVAPPNIQNEDELCNIVASADGQIEGIEVSSGKTEVKIGDVVLKGQLLVNGVVDDAFGNSRFCHAKGNIYAVTHKKETLRVSLNKEILSDNKKQAERVRFRFLNFCFPLSLTPIPKGNYSLKTTQTDLFSGVENVVFYQKYGNCNQKAASSTNTINTYGFKIPITIFKEKFTGFDEQTIRLSLDEAKAEVAKKIEEAKNERFKGIEILNINISEEINNNEYIVNINYECKENIATTENIEIN